MPVALFLAARNNAIDKGSPCFGKEEDFRALAVRVVATEHRRRWTWINELGHLAVVKSPEVAAVLQAEDCAATKVTRVGEGQRDASAAAAGVGECTAVKVHLVCFREHNPSLLLAVVGEEDESLALVLIHLLSPPLQRESGALQARGLDTQRMGQLVL